MGLTPAVSETGSPYLLHPTFPVLKPTNMTKFLAGLPGPGRSACAGQPWRCWWDSSSLEKPPSSPHMLHPTSPGLACPNMTEFGAGVWGPGSLNNSFTLLGHPPFLKLVAPCAHSSTGCTHGPENLHAWLNEFARQAGKVSGRGVQGMSQNGQL